jgi:colicin import membrane protein
MSLPKPPDKTIKSARKPNAAASAKDDPAFASNLAKLKEKAEAREQEAALERMRNKIASPGSGKAGMPAGKGTEAGSDYTAYIQSRLKDAFANHQFSSKTPRSWCGFHRHDGNCPGKVERTPTGL